MVFNNDEAPEEALARADAIRLEGNEMIGKGNFADAARKYEEGLLALVKVGGEHAPRAGELRLSLHLNAGLAELRRGNLGTAIAHCDGALGIDPVSAKALYRRGMARAQLARHTGNEKDSRLAEADLKKLLEVEPSNAEARKELQALRSSEESARKELNKSQKDSFKNMFSSGKALYEEAKKEPVPEHIRPAETGDRPLVLSCRDVAFAYEKNQPVLSGVNLELHAGWCVGLVGNNAEGKTTLARLLCGKLQACAGVVTHHGADGAPLGPPKDTSSLSISFAGAACIAAAGVLVAASVGRREAERLAAAMLWQHWALLAAAAFAVVLGLTYAGKAVLDAWRARRPAPWRRKVMHLSSEIMDKEEIKGTVTIEAMISELMPQRLSKEEKRELVIKMLKAGGFQMYNQETGEAVGTAEEYVRDGLVFGHLSGGQKHLMYVLRVFAARPDVLLCDELLGGLDSIRQPRVLHMLKRLMDEGSAVLYIGTELHQHRCISESIGFLSGGRMVEFGSRDEVFDFPKHPVSKEYLGVYRSMPGCQVIGGKLAENWANIRDDAALQAAWVPPRA